MLRILLVDDELFFRQGLREIIDWEACGYEVIGEQDNGEDALAFIVEKQPDVVITDIRMPEFDGLELIHKVVNEEKMSTKFIIVSGYDEFKYAQQAVRYGVCDFLLKPIDEEVLEKTLVSIREKLIEERKLTAHSLTQFNAELLHQLVQDNSTMHQLEVIYSRLKLNVEEKYYFLYIEYNHYPFIRSNEVFNQMKLDQFIANIQEVIPAVQHGHIFPQRGKVGLVISQSWLPQHTSIQSVMKQLHFKLHHQEDIKIHFYYSECYSGLEGLKQAIKGAEFAFQYKYVDGRDLYDSAELKELPLQHIMLSLDSFKGILHAMEDNDTELIAKEIQHLCDQFSKQGCSQEAIRATVHKLVADTLQILQTMQIDKQQLVHLNSMLNWNHYNIDILSLKRLIKQFINECGSLIATERKEMAKGGIQRIKKYIDQNFADNISLKSISAQFYINPVYLGQLFKKTYDVYFNEYLLQTRIHEAKKLLRQTDMKIYEIASRVGFNHAEYFVAQFEKTEKLKPTAYRQTFQSSVGE